MKIFWVELHSIDESIYLEGKERCGVHDSGFERENTKVPYTRKPLILKKYLSYV